MTYLWFKIFNKTEFDALGLVSRVYKVNLDGIGVKDILVTKGVNVGITYDGVFLPLQLNDKNPFEFETFAIAVNPAMDVFLGVPDES